MHSPCPHCHSAHHNLCEPGFRVKLSSSPWNPDCALLNETEQRDIVVLPIFDDRPLGPFACWLDERTGGLVSKAVEDTSSANQVILRNFAGIKRESNVWILIARVGPRASFDDHRFCELCGSALEIAALNGCGRLVFPMVDIDASCVQNQIHAATLRCRLAVLLCNRSNVSSLNHVLVLHSPESTDSVEHGLTLNGPFCLNCPQPRLIQLSPNHCKRSPLDEIEK